DTKVPSSLSVSLPQAPAEARRRAFVPAALMGTMFTGVVWPAAEGLSSRMLMVELFATLSIWSTARLPGVNGTGAGPMVNWAELVVLNGAQPLMVKVR